MSPESQPGIQLPVWFSTFSACACGKTGKHHFCRLRTVIIAYGIQILIVKCLVHATDIEPLCPSPQYIFVVLFLNWRNTCNELLGFPSVDRCYFGLCSSFRSTMEMAMADTYKSKLLQIVAYRLAHIFILFLSILLTIPNLKETANQGSNKYPK